MTPFVDAPDKFQYKWINLDSARLKASIGVDESLNITTLPLIIQAAREGNIEAIDELVSEGMIFNPFANKPWFLRVCHINVLKTL